MAATRKSVDLFETQKQRVSDIAQRLQDEFELGWINIVHLFNEAPHEEGNLAMTATQWEYRLAEITWALPSVASAADDELERICIHEYCHILLGPLEEFIPKKAAKQEEFVTESIARVILALRK